MEITFLLIATTLIVLISLFKTIHYREIVLLNQDYNPIAMSRAYWQGTPDTADDFELGGNCAAFVFSSLSFSLPVLTMGRIGRVKWFIWLHLLAVPAGVFLGTYLLGDALFGPMGGLFAAGLILAFPRRLFGFLNLCYPLLLDRYYYNEIAYIPLLGSLAATVNGNEWAAGIGMAMTTLINPTLGLTSGAVILLSLTFADLMAGTGGLPLGAALPFGAACLAEFALIRLNRPDIDPAPAKAREFAIRIYSHLCPHIHNPKRFLAATGISLAFLVCAALFEGYIRTQFAPHSLGLALGALTVAVLALPIYALLYMYIPHLIPTLAPAKVFMVTVFVIVAYMGGLLACLIWLLPEDVANWLFALVFLAMFGKALWYLGEPFRGGSLQLARDFLDIQLKAQEVLPPEAVVVPWLAPGTRRTAIGSFAQFPFRTFSERGAIIFWSLGRNAYLNSRLRHDCECRTFSFFGIVDPWELLQERIDARKEPLSVRCWGSRKAGRRWPSPNAYISEYQKLRGWLRTKVEAMTFQEFEQYADHLGATHVLVSMDDPADGPKSAPLAANSRFALIPISDHARRGVPHGW